MLLHEIKYRPIKTESIANKCEKRRNNDKIRLSKLREDLKTMIGKTNIVR